MTLLDYFCCTSAAKIQNVFQNSLSCSSHSKVELKQLIDYTETQTEPELYKNVGYLEFYL